MSFNRETEDRITKIMGSYLLKGYTLLDSHCPSCQTPLMKTRSSDVYCIFCNEVDTKSSDKKLKTNISNDCSMIEDIKDNESKNTLQNDIQTNDYIKSDAEREDFQRMVSVVNQKMVWATNRLQNCDQINDCLQITNFLKLSADLLLTLNRLNQNTKQ